MAANGHFHYSFEQGDGAAAIASGDATRIHDFFERLSEFQKYQISFHPERPKFSDYLPVFDQAEECFASDEFGSKLMPTYRAAFRAGDRSYPVMLIGQQSGPTSDYAALRELMKDRETVKSWNLGMPTPASYRRALKAIDAANTEGRLVITVMDTPGADPTEESEAGGIAWRIGDCIRALGEARVPTMSVIINRGCSGGAIALTGCDTVLAMEYSTYLVISPEACSSILYRTRDRAEDAARVSKITSRHGLAFGIVDELVREFPGPAHRYPEEAKASLRRALEKHIPALMDAPRESLFERRVERWRRIGKWDTLDEGDVKAVQRFHSRLPEVKSGFVKRHEDCYDEEGNHLYDPVPFRKLRAANYVCDVCGHRYARPSAWDYIAEVLDPDSFREHAETRLIADHDLLGFPGYAEKIAETRRLTGLAAAMITGDGRIDGHDVVFCATDFGFLGASFGMSTGEKIWQACEIAIRRGVPIVLQAAGGGARMHEGCSSMVSIPKVHVALTRVERAGLPVVTITTDPTLGGVAIGYACRGTRYFEVGAGNIGFSGKRVIEQFTGRKTSDDFQTTAWLKRHGHVSATTTLAGARADIGTLLRGRLAVR